MNLKQKSQSGSAQLVILLLLVLVVVAAVGWRVLKNDHKTSTNNAASSTAPLATQPPSTISNASDLSTAQAALNQANIDGDLNPNSLNADVNSLL